MSIKKIIDGIPGTWTPDPNKTKRQQFEEWYRCRWPDPISETEYTWAVRRRDSGRYAEQDVYLAWEAWRVAWELGDKCRHSKKMQFQHLPTRN